MHTSHGFATSRPKFKTCGETPCYNIVKYFFLSNFPKSGSKGDANVNAFSTKIPSVCIENENLRLEIVAV